ncbi:hypothetical protein D3C87_652880 [compost metagenome]
MYGDKKYWPLLDRLLSLIKLQQMRKPKDGAKKLGCSVRTLKYRIARLRQEGHAINYDRKLQRYVLREDKEQGVKTKIK